MPYSYPGYRSHNFSLNPQFAVALALNLYFITRMFKALYDFNAEEEGELTIRENDSLLDCTGTDPTPEGWILVKNSKTLQVGFVPRNYIENVQNVEIVPVDTPNKTTARSFSNSEKSSVQSPAHNNTNTNAILSKLKGSLIHQGTTKNSSSFLQTPQSIRPNESVFAVTSETTTGNVRALSRSSSRESLHSLGSTGGALNKQLHSSNSKQSLFSVVQTAKAVNKVTAKFSVNQIPVVPIVKVPAFASMAERESYGELVNSTSEYLERLSSGQSDSYGLHMRTLDEFAGVITQNMKSSAEVMAGFSQLDELLVEEKRKIKIAIDAERNADVLSRSGLMSHAVKSS